MLLAGAPRAPLVEVRSSEQLSRRVAAPTSQSGNLPEGALGMKLELTPEQAINILQLHLDTNPDIKEVTLRLAMYQAIEALQLQIALEPRVIS